jgi:hypothetical protein
MFMVIVLAIVSSVASCSGSSIQMTELDSSELRSASTDPGSSDGQPGGIWWDAEGDDLE